MAAGTALTVAQTLFSALDSSVLKEICSVFGYKSQLEELKDTVTVIKAVLLDADAKQEDLPHGYQDWVDKLKDALYDVNDLFDEFNTIAQQQQQLGGCGWNNISEKVQRFFSHSNQVLFALNMYRQTKKSKKKLDAIASNYTKFGLSAISVGMESRPTQRRPRETPSYVDEKRIFGRDNDKNNIVGMLLDSNVSEDVSFVTIVGMGGLGKTTLAQLVYKDERIQKEFEELRMWVCVSDNFDVKQIFSKMLMSATGQKCDDLDMDSLGRKLQKEMQGKKYLLVLDDVWEETPDNWTVLTDYLNSGGRGSKILVTSRSKMVGRAVRNAQMYELKGLAEEDAWLLFAERAFDKGGEHADADLVEISKDIIKKCANVPLSIRVVGSLLWGQEKEKWLLFQKTDLAKIQEAREQTMAILKSSYYHLSSPLKSCFSCCALFPKDHDIGKKDLIHLWMARGFLAPRYDGQSIEDVGEDYFSILVQRCFFQDIGDKEYSACNVHDLMHDLAVEVGGGELLVLPSATHDFDRKIRYISILNPQEHIPLADIKTSHVILQLSLYEPELIGEDGVSKIISHGRCLRFLDLSGVFSRRTMPSGIGRLIHLRYLDLSHWHKLEMLPGSITKLCNLQVLKLRDCGKLRALPAHFSRLVNLRHLDISHCKALSHMPTGMKELTCLHTLTRFVVGGDSEKVQMSNLEDLKALVNLKDDLTIEIKEFRSNETSKIKRGAYLLDKQHLTKLRLEFAQSYWQGQEDVEEALLEGFQPNHNLRTMQIEGYAGVKFPSWALRENPTIYLPLLVKIQLENLPWLQHLPSFSQLRFLEKLSLWNIRNLEYMESESSYVSSAHWTFYPSLVELYLWNLPKVKGLWRDGVMVDAEGGGRGCSSSTREQGGGNGHEMSSLLLFPNLRELTIKECPSMKLFPPCPHVEELTLKGFNEELVFGERIGRADNHNDTSGLSTTTASSGDTAADTGVESVRVVSQVVSLKKLQIDNSGFMSRLPEESIQGLPDLIIDCSEEERLSTAEVFRSCASSLQFLRIKNCRKLKSVRGGGIEHLTYMQTLELITCDELELEDEDENGTPWNSLRHLSSLGLGNLPKVANLPKGIQFLTALHSLSIDSCSSLRALPEWLGCLSSLRSLGLSYCDELKSLPEAMRDLTSLTRLEIIGCPHLNDRCRRPDGEDWPKICHVSNIIVKEHRWMFDW